MEANPGDLSDDVIKVLAHSAVNRISLGVQTFNNTLLKKLGELIMKLKSMIQSNA